MGRRREQFVATVRMMATAFAAAPALAASDDDIWQLEARLDHHVDAVRLSDLKDLDDTFYPRCGVNPAPLTTRSAYPGSRGHDGGAFSHA